MGGGVFHNVSQLRDRLTGLQVIVDERTIKTRESTTRKMFQANPLDLLDIFSINFVLADDNFRDSSDPIGDRLRAAVAFRNNFRNHLLAQLREGDSQGIASVEVVEGTYKAGSIENVQEIVEGSWTDREFAGVRVGSMGDAIIREKFVLKITDKYGKTQYCEIGIFPFESSKTKGVSKLGRAGMWGFVEKFKDDYEGNYKARRIVARERKHLTKHSLYEMLYPGHLYKELAERMRQRHVRSARARGRAARARAAEEAAETGDDSPDS
jgi:hypothetical protein